MSTIATRVTGNLETTFIHDSICCYSFVFTVCYAPINLKPRGWGGGGYTHRIDSVSASLGGDFDIWVLPWGQELDIAKTCFGQKVVPRGGNLTFSRCSRVRNLTLALVNMSNSPGSACSPTLGFNIDRCTSYTYWPHFGYILLYCTHGSEVRKTY